MSDTSRRVSALLAAVAVVAFGCGRGPTAPAPTASAGTATPDAPTPAASTIDLARARADLDHLLERLELIHPKPFHGVDRATWIAGLEALKSGLAELEPFEAQVELQRLVALLSREGRDGHQFALPLEDAEGPALPIRVYEFEEGVYITDALPPNAALAGARLVAIAGQPIGEVLAALEPLVPRDGPATVPGFRPIFLTRTSVLRGLGLVGEGPVELTFTLGGGGERVITVDPVPFADWLAWVGPFGATALPPREELLYLSRPSDIFWFERLSSTSVLYVRYAQVQSVAAADLAALRDAATAGDVERVVLDLRQNPGGDNHLFPPILDVLRDPAVNRPDRLYVLTDRLTFSAASNFATSIEAATSAVFAGEPMGGGLNFWDDVDWVILGGYPVPMQVGVSTRYWQFAAPDDPRLTIEPEIAVPTRAADWLAGRDPVLEAVLSR